MTRTRSKHASQKVSVQRNKMFRKQTLPNGTKRNRSNVGKVKPISNLRQKLTIPQTQQIASSKGSQNVISQQDSLDVPSDAEDETVEQTKLSVHQTRRNSDSSSSHSHEDQDMFDAKDEHSQAFEEDFDNESIDEKDNFSMDEDITEEEVGEYQEQNFISANQGKNNDSIVSSITQGTTHLHAPGPGRKTYADLLIMLQEKERTISKLSKQITEKDIHMIEFTCSQEKTVIETTKKYIFPCQQFLRNQDVLNDFTTKNSIGKVLMDKLDIPLAQRQAFWYTYKNSVRKGIKQQRCIAHNALKEKFLCK